MESWKDETNLILTTNQSLWVQLMNQSTSEWTLGPFPPNVYAVNITYNGTFPVKFPDGALVIQNAGVAMAGTAPVEALVFGLVSAAALIWAFWWTWKEYKNDTWNHPPKKTRSRSSKGGNTVPSNTERRDLRDGSSTLVGDSVDYGSAYGFPSAREFQNELTSKYYESIVSEIEALDGAIGSGSNRPLHTPLSVEEVEIVQDLLRKLYRFELEIFGQSMAQNPDMMRGLHARSAAALMEIQQTVGRWAASPYTAHRWSQNEVNYLRSMTRDLTQFHGCFPMCDYNDGVA